MSQTNYVQMESGLIAPASSLPHSRPEAVDLFCGCGGFSLRVMQAGFEVVAAADWDETAALTYMTNFGNYPTQIHFAEPKDRDRLDTEFEKADKRRRKEGIDVPLTSGSAWISSQSGIPGAGHFFFGDIAKLSGHQILDVLEMEPGELDLVVGGPPCQGFTRANPKAGPNDPRNELVFEFARVTLELHPKTFCMENVPEVARMKTPEGLLVMDALKLAIESGSMDTLYALRHFLRGNPEVSCAVVGEPKSPKEASAQKIEEGPLFRWKSKEKR